MNESAIKIESLTKQFEDKTALENLNLQVAKGELFGLLGPNGAGKTTTINILCGLIKPTSGTAKVCGYDVQKETQKVKELIGVCTQETAIYPYLTGAENLELFGNLNGMNKKALKERSRMLLTQIGLNGRCKKNSCKIQRRYEASAKLISRPNP